MLLLKLPSCRSLSAVPAAGCPLPQAGVIFCSMSEAIREYPDLVRKHLGSVVPVGDNYFTALNSAVFSDGSFVYIPKVNIFYHLKL